MKNHIIYLLCCLSSILHSQELLEVSYDFDKDGKLDKFSLETSYEQGQRLVAQLSSQKEMITSPWTDFSTGNIGLSNNKEVINLHLGFMRATYDYKFRYDASLQTFLLIGHDDEQYGNAANDASGTSSYNFLTGDYWGKFNHFDVEKDELITLPIVKKKFSVEKYSIEEFNGFLPDEVWMNGSDCYQEAKIKYISRQEPKKLHSEEEIQEYLCSIMWIDEDEIYDTGIVMKKMPNENHTYIVVIPESEEVEEGYYLITSHILTLNLKNGQILNYRRKYQDWVSDAIYLFDIVIDTAPYMLQKNKRAFGVRLLYRGSSRPNPYFSEEIALFMPENESFSKVLDFTIDSKSGEWDMNCNGSFEESRGIIIVDAAKTNGWHDLIVKSTISNTELKDCEETINSTTQTQRLSFQNRRYQVINE